LTRLELGFVNRRFLETDVLENYFLPARSWYEGLRLGMLGILKIASDSNKFSDLTCLFLEALVLVEELISGFGFNAKLLKICWIND
jgi:hypothetical protein